MQVSNNLVDDNPLKKRVRWWMQQRQVEKTPPPTPEQVRQALGWHLVNAKAPECAR